VAVRIQKYMVQMPKEVRYGRWRDYKPEETRRFYALRLYEVGASSRARRRSSPTAPRLLNELRKDLKG